MIEKLCHYSQEHQDFGVMWKRSKQPTVDAAESAISELRWCSRFELVSLMDLLEKQHMQNI